VDSRHKVLYVSAKCAGAIHDNLAFSVSTLHHRLMSGELQDGFWIAADEAYTSTDSIVTPWPALGLMDPAKDAFNFFQSSLRMHVEQVFGQIHSRFVILWKPLRYSIDKVLPISLSIFHIHNLCIDRKDPSVPTEPAEETRNIYEILERWVESSVNSYQKGKRRDLEVSNTRMRLTYLLTARGITRPNL
jgi:hypothetical protein